MKKVFTLFATALITIGAIAQQLPNGGFESWTSTTHPDMWGTYGNIVGFPGGGTYPYFATKDNTITNFVEGTASLKMITDTIAAGPGNYLIVPSIAGLGTLSYTASHSIVASGIAYTKRVDTIFLSYKYAPTRATDTASMRFNLSKASTSLFGGTLGLNLSTTAGAWKNIYIPISSAYTSSNNPDTLSMVFSTSRYSGAPADTGAFKSTLWIDAIHFNAAVNVSGIAEIGAITGVNAYPNPTHDIINIAIEESEIGSQMQLFDLQCREVYNGILDRTTTAIDTKNYEAGIYAIKVLSIDHMTTYQGKITVTK